MENRPVPAKVTRPQAADSTPRPRLFKWLDHARRRPVIWVLGPPGSGKTTLICNYLQRRRLTTLWYQADAGDTDIATFFHYLGFAAQKAAPRYRRPLPRFTPERLGDLDHFAREFFSELYSRIKTPFVIVFDNYQEIPMDARLHEVVRLAVESLPKGGHLVGISRQEPPGSMARARLNESLAILDDTALRLTLEEAVAIARHRFPKRHSRQEIAVLHEATHGWAAGLTLLLEPMHGHIPENTATLKTPGVLFEYFANEVFAKTDADTRAVLLKSVFLPTMTVHTVATLTEERRASRILNHLCRNNFFTYRFDLPEPVFQYHPLFREFLLSRTRRLPAPELTNLQQRAATILESNNQHESALSLYQEIGEWEGFARCLKKIAPGLIAQGRHQALEHWLSRLPADRIEHDPWILHYEGLCHQLSHPKQSLQRFSTAHDQFVAAGDLPGLLCNWSAIIDTYITEWTDLKPIQAWIEAIERIPEVNDALRGTSAEPEMACSLFQALLYGRPMDPELPLWAERAGTILRTTSDPQLRAKVAPHLLNYYVWSDGDLPRAEALFHGMRSITQERDISPIYRIAWHASAAGLQWMTAKTTECIAETNLALSLADNAHVHGWDTRISACGVLAAVGDRHTEEADSYFSRLDSTHNPANPLDSGLYYLLKAGHHFVQNDLPRAREYLEQGLRCARDAGYINGEADCMTDLARVMYYQGEHVSAWDMLHDARLLATRMRNHILEYQTWLTEAEFALLAGDDAMCRDALNHSLSIARRQHIRNHRWWRGDQMARLYARALDSGIETEYVLGMIRQSALQPPEEARESESWPFPFKVYTLGRFALVKEDQSLSVSGKAQSKPLELLKALIALGGRQVGATHLSEILWPDAEGDSAQRAFDTTLHRLRRLFGSDQALQLSDSKLSLNPALCWVDSWAFERLMGHLDLLLKQPAADVTHYDRITQMTRKLFALHHGPFLGREHVETWAIAPRERLDQRYLVLLGALGRYWETNSQWERAVETYQKAIDVQFQSEEYYQRLMQAYHHLGRTTEAAAVYQRCRETLLATTGRLPSQATETIHRALDESH